VGDGHDPRVAHQSLRACTPADSCWSSDEAETAPLDERIAAIGGVVLRQPIEDVVGRTVTASIRRRLKRSPASVDRA
jgi:hypothetical protein